MSTKSVAVRIGLEGQAEVKRDFGEMRAAGETAFDGVGSAAEAAGQKASSAADRMAQRWANQAKAAKAQMQASLAQGDFNRTLGVGVVANGSAQQSAEFFRAMAEEEERAAAMARALKAQLDPLAAAQDRYNRELAEYQALAARGVITDRERIAAEAMLRKRLDETTEALRRQGGLSRQALAGRVNLARQGADVFTMAAMGASPGMIAVSQGPQILDAMATSGFKARGAMIALAGGVGITVGSLALLAKAWRDNERSQAGFNVQVRGAGRTLGLTGQEFRALAHEAAEAGNVSKRTAEQFSQTYARTGRIGVDTVRGLVEITKDFGLAMGMDASAAAQRLAQNFASPKEGAEQLNAELGILDARTQRQIVKLVDQNRTYEAQAILLRELKAAIGGAAEETDSWSKAWDRLGIAASNAWSNLGETIDRGFQTALERDVAARNALKAELAKPSPYNAAEWARNPAARAKAEANLAQLDARLAPHDQEEQGRRARQVWAAEQAKLNQADQARRLAEEGKKDGRAEQLARDTAALSANTKATLDLAQAWLKGAEEAAKFEAARKAAVDEVRKGADEQERARQHLAAWVADQAAAGAQAVNGAQVEAEAKKRLNDAVASGSMTQEQAERQMRDEAVLRPLLAAQALAEGAAKSQLAAVIEAMRKAQADLNVEDERAVALARAKALADQARASNDNVATMQLELSLLRASNEERAIALAQLRAEQELDRDKVTDPAERQKLIDARVNEARTGAGLDWRRQAADSVRAQEAELRLLGVRASVIGLSEEAQRRLVDQVEVENRLLAAGIPLHSAEADQIRLNAELIRKKNEQILKGQELQRQAEQAAGLIVDAIKGGVKSGDWGDAGKALVQSVVDSAAEEMLWRPLHDDLVAFLTGVGKEGGEGLYQGIWRAISRLFDIDWSGLFPNGAVNDNGGGGWLASAWGAAQSFLPGFASGVDHAPGGWAQVHKDEVLYLPRGAKVERASSARGRFSEGLGAAVSGPSAVPAAAGPIKVELHNHGGQPMRAEASQDSAGNMKLDLYPAYQDMARQAVQDGTIPRAMGSHAPTRRRG